VARVSIAGVVELLLFVLCVAQLDRILCEYSAWAIGKLGAMHCSCGTVVGYCLRGTMASPLGFHPRRPPIIL
jgi:hypothetical protein